MRAYYADGLRWECPWRVLVEKARYTAAKRLAVKSKRR